MKKLEKKLRTSEASRYLGIENQVLIELSKQNKGPRFTSGYNGNRYTKSDLDEWINSLPGKSILKAWNSKKS